MRPPPSCLRWTTAGPGKRSDLVAGTRNSKGYWYVRMKGVYDNPKLVHLIIWEHFNGPIPQGLEVDHIKTKFNGVSNLRLVNSHQQAYNTRSPVRKYELPKGITPNGEREGNYRAQIRFEGWRYTKCGKDIQALEAWIIATRAALHGEYANFD